MEKRRRLAGVFMRFKIDREVTAFETENMLPCAVVPRAANVAKVKSGDSTNGRRAKPVSIHVLPLFTALECGCYTKCERKTVVEPEVLGQLHFFPSLVLYACFHLFS
jgi:hypothetical protein